MFVFFIYLRQVIKNNLSKINLSKMNNQEKLTSEDILFLQKNTTQYYKNVAIIGGFIAFVIAGLLLWYKNEFTYKENLVSVCVGFAMVLYVFFNAFKESQKLKKEIENGYKEIILDTITVKPSPKQKYTIIVRNITYDLAREEYDSFEENDNIRIEITPITRTVIKISKQV